jgi:hypothetical protein
MITALKKFRGRAEEKHFHLRIYSQPELDSRWENDCHIESGNSSFELEKSINFHKENGGI